MGKMSRSFVLSVLLTSVLLLAGCSDQGPTYTVVHHGGWQGGPPKPEAAVVLTVILPDGRSYDLDRVALQRLTWVKRTTKYHPKKNEPQAVFEGVLLADLIKEMGVVETGLRVRFTALDDYQIEHAWKELEPLEPILALKQNGNWLTVDDYGPIRITLPYDHLRPDPTKYNALWVWQLRIIELRNP